MSVIQKLIDAQDNQDLKAYNEVVSEDYVWVKHSTGEEIPRDELSKWLISPDAPKSENARIIYENDEIGVAHYFVSFKDGSRQAVLVVYTIKDGKIIRSETGATNITKK
jgi:ketosteroid isomerase-like protein|tara:strand:- start:492 stop:818 length:327 start_codon:yes stop_codon:yes gene_type:complete